MRERASGLVSFVTSRISARRAGTLSGAPQDDEEGSGVDAARLPGGKSLTVASYNIHKCVGTDRRFDPDRIIDVVCEMDPDILALQEADQRFGARAGLLDLALLKMRTGLEPVPLAGGARSHGWHGNVLLARLGAPVALSRRVLPGLEPRGLVMADFALVGGERLRVMATHLGLTRGARRAQARAILDMAQVKAHEGGSPVAATVLMGDLNEWRLGERAALRLLEPMFGPLPHPLASFPTRLPVFALDRIFASRPGLIAHHGVHDSKLSRIASDHLPVTARLDLCKLASERQSSHSGQIG